MIKLDWSKVTQEHAQFLQDYINEQIAKHPADFVHDLVVSDLSFGDSPPEIQIVNVADPFDALTKPPRGALAKSKGTTDAAAQPQQPNDTKNEDEPSRRVQKPSQTLDRSLDIPVRGLDSVVNDDQSAHIATSGAVLSSAYPTTAHRAASMQGARNGRAAVYSRASDRDIAPGLQTSASNPALNIHPGATRAASARSTPAITRSSADLTAMSLDERPQSAHSLDCDDSDSELDDQELFIEDMYRIPRVKSGPEYVQLEARIKYSGNVRCKVTGELTLNAPTPAFVSLPVILTLCGLYVDAMLILVYRETKELRISLLHPVANPNAIVDVQFDSQIGDSQQSVLRHVEKLETFLVTVLRKIVSSTVQYPNSVAIDLANLTSFVGHA